MALKKQKTLGNGVVGNYWKITSVSINKIGMSISCRRQLFVDSTFSHVKPISDAPVKAYRISGSSSDMAGNVVQLCYSHIKSTPDTDLDGAEDV